MDTPMRISRELPGATAQASEAVLPAILSSRPVGLPGSEPRMSVLLRGASMWVLEAAVAVGALATALLLGVGR